MKVSNPFLIKGYYSPAYFCNRNQETERMLSAVKNNRNLTLVALRRIGKTGLIHHLFHYLKKEKNTECFYFDILPTLNLAEFIAQLGKSLIGSLDSTPEKTIKKIGTLFSGLRPSIKYDALTGEPSIEFDLQAPFHAEHSLEQIFQYLQKQNKKIVIAIDEFQQITHYPEKNTEALLRSHVQKSNNIHFIFSGSQQHVLTSMFTAYKKPFYQSTEMMFLEKINRKEYAAFIRQQFQKGGKNIEMKIIEDLLDWTRVHTWYVQYVCNKLFDLREENISSSILHEEFRTILKENEGTYYNYRNLLTDYQFLLLRAVAKEGGVEQPTSKEFIKKYNLGAASSVKTALTSLTEKEIVYREKGKYFIDDLFFSRWLERL